MVNLDKVNNFLNISKETHLQKFLRTAFLSEKITLVNLNKVSKVLNFLEESHPQKAPAHAKFDKILNKINI